MDFWLGKIGDNYYSGHCKIYEEAMSIKMLNPDAILSATIVYAKWGDYMQIWVGGDKAWSGPNNNFPPETSGACELSTSWEWMDILKVTDNMPGMKDLSLDGMTGEGSYLGELAAKEGETRPDTAERNGERLDGVDLGKLNQKASDEMWRAQ